MVNFFTGLDLPELSLPLLSVELGKKFPIPRSPSEISKPSVTGPLPGPFPINPGTIISPSSSVRSPHRHQTFAQRLRSSSKSVRGMILQFNYFRLVVNYFSFPYKFPGPACKKI